MSETRTVFDPFELKAVEISNRLVDRLRGKYASGPHLPNGNPEFGWRQFEAPPIQHEAADVIEAKDAEIASLRAQLDEAKERAHYATGVAETNIKRANGAADEARRKAIEDAAQVADEYALKVRSLMRGVPSVEEGTAQSIAKLIRALLSESKT